MFSFRVALCLVNVASADHGRVVSRPWLKKEMKNTQVEQTTVIDRDYISCAAARNFCLLCRSLTAHASVCPAPLGRAQWLLLCGSRQPGIHDLLIRQG